MTWTHCRCCGKELILKPDKLDGLCFDKTSPCTVLFERSEFGRAFSNYAPSIPGGLYKILSSPERSVAIDAWLEAGAK